MGTANRFMVPVFNGWRGAFLFIAFICFIMGILWLLLYRDPQTEEGASSEKENIASNFKKALRIRDVRLLALYYGFFLLGLMSAMGLLPVILQERGIERAGEYVSIMMIISFIAKIALGMVSDKMGKRKLFLVLGGIITGLCMPGCLILAGIPLLLLLAICGIASGPPVPIMMTATVEVEEVGKALSGTALGIVLMIGTVGGFVGPIIAGFLIDISGPWGGFIFMMLASLAAGLVVVPSRVK